MVVKSNLSQLFQIKTINKRWAEICSGNKDISSFFPFFFCSVTEMFNRIFGNIRNHNNNNNSAANHTEKDNTKKCSASFSGSSGGSMLRRTMSTPISIKEPQTQSQQQQPLHPPEPMNIQPIRKSSIFGLSQVSADDYMQKDLLSSSWSWIILFFDKHTQLCVTLTWTCCTSLCAIVLCSISFFYLFSSLSFFRILSTFVTHVPDWYRCSASAKPTPQDSCQARCQLYPDGVWYVLFFSLSVLYMDIPSPPLLPHWQFVPTWKPRINYLPTKEFLTFSMHWGAFFLNSIPLHIYRWIRCRQDDIHQHLVYDEHQRHSQIRTSTRSR